MILILMVEGGSKEQGSVIRDAERHRETEMERMMKAAAVIVFALAVCGGARGQDIPADSIAGVALGVPDLSILVDAAVATDLVGALSDPTSEFTVFAPTNDAFVRLLGERDRRGRRGRQLRRARDRHRPAALRRRR